MTEVSPPIFTPAIRNIDQSMSKDNAFRLMDGYLCKDGNGEWSANSRPGLQYITAIDLAAAPADIIDGAYWWDDGGMMILLLGGYVLSFTYSGGIYGYTILNAAGTVLNVGTRPTFATDGTYVYIANGGRILRTDGITGAGAAFIADVDAPTAVTHILNVDGYLLANNVGNQKIYFSALEDFSTWSALDFFSAGGVSDDILAQYEFQKEIYIFGTRSFEIWEDDGETPFSRINGGYRNVGCSAPYSVVNTDDGVMWLDNKKRIVKYSGGGIDHVATPYDKDLQRMVTFADCQADRLDIEGREFYLFAFPGENRTLVYNLTDDNWTEWGYWNSSGGFWERFVGNCYAFSPTWNQHIWGTRKADGNIFKMSPDFVSDLSSVVDNPIRMQSLSGHISYGTNKRKRNDLFSIRAKRGRAIDSSEPMLVLRVNDDDKGWSNEINLSLGKLGETFNIIRKHRLGVYHTRQYEFTATGATGISFGQAKEDIYVENK